VQSRSQPRIREVDVKELIVVGGLFGANLLKGKATSGLERDVLNSQGSKRSTKLVEPKNMEGGGGKDSNPSLRTGRRGPEEVHKAVEKAIETKWRGPFIHVRGSQKTERGGGGPT